MYNKNKKLTCRLVALCILFSTAPQCLPQTTQQRMLSMSTKDNQAEKPTAYFYDPRKGTIDQQTRANRNQENEYSEISKSHLKTNSGYYAILATIFGSFAFVYWRRSHRAGS